MRPVPEPGLCWTRAGELLETRSVLGDPKKLRTRGGFGYLVGRNNLLRTQGEAQARRFAERLLADELNIRAFRAALGRPDAALEELEEWLISGLAGGAFAALRTGPRPAALRSPRAEDLVDLVHESRARERGNELDRESDLTFVSVEVVDEDGRRPGGGELRFSLNGAFSTHEAFERVERKRLHPSSQAGAGCLSLDFETPVAEDEQIPAPLGPDTLPPDAISFEVVSEEGEPLVATYRLSVSQVELGSGRTTGALVGVESVTSPVLLELKL